MSTMPESCLLYYITDRTTLASDEPTRRHRLMEKISEATRAGVDYIQLREKDLSTNALECLAKEAVSTISKLRTENRELKTALLINSRTDVALAIGANGVHLRSDDVGPENVGKIWLCGAGTPFDQLRAGSRQRLPQAPLIAVSCHSPEEVTNASAHQATFAVFSPVFEKKDFRPAGLPLLKEACQANIPVLALGGVTLENAHSCLQAGAAGVAAIRLFQKNNIAKVVKRLRQT